MVSSTPIHTSLYAITKDKTKLQVSPSVTISIYLVPGNIIKLGRVEFRVVEIGGLPKVKGGKKYENLLGEFNGFHEAT